MADNNDDEIRIYTTLSSNNADGFLTSIYDNPGTATPGLRMHDNPPNSLINHTVCAKMIDKASANAHDAFNAGDATFLRYGRLVETYMSNHKRKPEYVARSPGEPPCSPRICYILNAQHEKNPKLTFLQGVST